MFAQLIIHFLILSFQLIQCQSHSINQNTQDYLVCNGINCEFNLGEHTLGNMNSDGKALLVVGQNLILEGNVVLSGFSVVTFSNLIIDTHCFQIESDSKLVFINCILSQNLKIIVPSVMFQDTQLLSIKYENEGIFPNSQMIRTSLKNMVLINTQILSDLLHDVILDSCIIINSTFIGKIEGLSITNSSIFDSQMLINSDLNNISIDCTRFSKSTFISNNLVIINNFHITNSIMDQSQLIEAKFESELNIVVIQNITTNANLIILIGQSTIIMNLTLISIQTSFTIFTINTISANISNIIISSNQIYEYRVFLIDQVDVIYFNNIQMITSNLVQLIHSNYSNIIHINNLDINNIKNQQIEIFNFNQPEMLNITNIQLKNIFATAVLVKINNSNVVNIQNGLFQNIFTQEIITLTNGIYSEIQYLDFMDIHIQNGTININNSGKSKLFDLSFVNIVADYGGGIKNKNSPLILSNITFDNMTAIEGGAIYLEQVKLEEISINEITYVSTTAQKGDKILLKTTYLDNQLQNSFVDGPVYIYTNNQTYSIYDLLSNNSRITFPKIKSAQNNEYILYLQDTSKQNICEQIDTILFGNQTINISGSCSFNINFKHLQIQPINETILIPIVFQDGNQIILYFEMQECELGEIWIEQSCTKCQAGTYSLNYMQNCQNCPSSVQACLGGALLVLREGYWRPNNLTDQIELCSISSTQCQGGSDNFTCQEGYVGALCNDCDYYQIYWPQSYSQSILEGCEQCNTNFYSTLKVVFSLLWIFIALIMSVRGALKMVRAQLQGYYLKVLGFLFATRSMMVIDQTEILIKIFTGYFQLVSIVMVLEVNLPFPFDYMISAIGSPLKTLAYSTECLLLYMNLDEEIIYLKQMWSLFLSLLLIIILVAMFAVFKVCKKQENSLKIIFSTSIIQVFYYFQGDIIQGMLSLLFCIKASGEYYIQAATQYLCYTEEYYFHMKLLIIPTLSVVAIILPLFYLLKLIFNRNRLWTCKFRSQYGYLFTEYKDNFYFWEFIKMFLKFLFYILQTVLLQEVKLMFLLAILCLVIYQELLCIYMPYIDKRYNHLEKLSIQFAIVTLVLAYFQDSNPYLILVYISQIFCAALNLLYILYFFLRLLLELCIEFKHILNSYIIYLLKRYIWLNKYIKKPTEFKLKKRVQFLWKKARFEVQSFMKGLKPQENSEQQSSLDKKANFSIDLSNEPNLLNSLKPSYLKLIQRQTTMRESQSPQTRDQSPQTRAFSPQASPGQFDNFSMAISTYFQTKTQSEHVPSQTTIAQLYQKKHSKEIAKVYPEPGQETNFKKLIKKAF